MSVETLNRHETATLRTRPIPTDLIRERQALYLVDRAFIDSYLSDPEKRAHVINAATRILLAMRLASTRCSDSLSTIKALRRHARRRALSPDQPDGTDRRDWAAPRFRYTGKISRQVLQMPLITRVGSGQRVSLCLGRHPHGAADANIAGLIRSNQ